MEPPQIELEPRHVRQRPEKGQPFFAPGGLRRMGLYFAGWVVIGLIVLVYHVAIGQWILAAVDAWWPINAQ
jgi:hypothetical protein